MTAPGADGIAGARAHWLTAGIVAWDAADAAAVHRLHTAADGGMTRTGAARDGGVVGGDAVQLGWLAARLPASLARRWPHLADHATLTVPDPVDVPTALRGQVAVSRSLPGARTDVTGLQIAGVLDDLYAQTAVAAALGVSWEQGTPTLRLWAPTARAVRLHLFDHAADGPPGRTHPMALDDASGVWTVRGGRTWDRLWYLYEVEVYVPSTGVVERNLVTDPYSTSLAADSTKSQIVDLADPALQPPGWGRVGTTAPSSPVQLAIYELHVRDFSIADETVPAAHRGTYLAFTDRDSLGMRHLRGLADAGMTTVHLLPTADMATVPERVADREAPHIPDAEPASAAQQAAVLAVADRDGFNWGYDPFHFTTPEGSYATDPDGVGRIIEFRAMVQALHATGLGVVADVVYNHTARSGQHVQSVLDRIVPGYFHRLLADGSVATSTCCANTATEHALMQKLVVDSVVTWATAYKVDGFRFDLMGHHPRSGMLAVRAALDALTPDDHGVDGRRICLYGEGWDFGEVAGDARFVQATQRNMAGTGIGTFNDRLRDAVRGGGPLDDDPHVQGFASGLATLPAAGRGDDDRAARRDRLLLAADRIRVGLAGNLAEYRFVSRDGRWVTGAQVPAGNSPTGYTEQPSENVLYVSAHDNETLFDALVFKLPRDTRMEHRIRMHMVALSTVALGQGLSFFHAGTDILRSKSLDRNSYDSGDHFNAIDWSYRANNFGVGLPPAPENRGRWATMRPLLDDPGLRPQPTHIAAAAAHFRDLLALAASTPLFSLPTARHIHQKLRFLNTGPDQTPGLIVMHIDDTVGRQLDGRLDGVVAVFNAGTTRRVITAPALAGATVALSPVQERGADDVVRTAGFDDASGTFTVPARTTAVFEVRRR